MEQWDLGRGRAMKKASRMCMTPVMLSLWQIIHSKASDSMLNRKGGAPEPKGEYSIEEVKPFPLHA